MSNVHPSNMDYFTRVPKISFPASVLTRNILLVGTKEIWIVLDIIGIVYYHIWIQAGL